MPKPKGAGDLRDRVKFQRRVEVEDDYGNTQGGWADLDISRAASLSPTRGGETVQAARVTGSAMWDCWVRSDSGTRSVNTGDRIVDERDPTRVINITFAEDMDRRREWILMQGTSGLADG